MFKASPVHCFTSDYRYGSYSLLSQEIHEQVCCHCERNTLFSQQWQRTQKCIIIRQWQIYIACEITWNTVCVKLLTHYYEGQTHIGDPEGLFGEP